MIKLKLKDREISLPKNSKYLLPGNRSTLNFIPLFGFFSNFENIKTWHFEPFSPPCSILNFFTVFEYFVIFGLGLGILGSDKKPWEYFSSWTSKENGYHFKPKELGLRLINFHNLSPDSFDELGDALFQGRL